jgi:transcriptional regulator with XRE-family HTH domain
MNLHATRTKFKMTALGVSQAQLAAYSGIHVNTISNFINGIKDMDNVRLLKLLDCVAVLEKLVESASPWPLDLRRVDEIKALIDQMQDGELDATIRAMKQEYARVAPEPAHPEQELSVGQ